MILIHISRNMDIIWLSQLRCVLKWVGGRGHVLTQPPVLVPALLGHRDQAPAAPVCRGFAMALPDVVTGALQATGRVYKPGAVFALGGGHTMSGDAACDTREFLNTFVTIAGDHPR